MTMMFHSESGNPTTERDDRLGLPRRRMLSVAYFGDAIRTIPTLLALGDCDFMFDSGAFTAWKQDWPQPRLGRVIDQCDELAQLVRDVSRVHFINLDVIPGRFGTNPTASEIAEAIKVSDENFYRLVEMFGDCVLPVFHQGEDLKRLAAVNAQSDYLCLSPRNDLPEPVRIAWAREIARYELPLGKRIYGLATTGPEMLTAAPWTSVDSASAMNLSSYGEVYTASGKQLHVSKFVDKRSARDDELLAEWGFTLEELVPRDAYHGRLVWNRLMLDLRAAAAGRAKLPALFPLYK
jgi:hypothetical protein